jgi:hypothetical protein
MPAAAVVSGHAVGRYFHCAVLSVRRLPTPSARWARGPTVSAAIRGPASIRTRPASTPIGTSPIGQSHERLDLPIVKP